MSLRQIAFVGTQKSLGGAIINATMKIANSSKITKATAAITRATFQRLDTRIQTIKKQASSVVLYQND